MRRHSHFNLFCFISKIYKWLIPIDLGTLLTFLANQTEVYFRNLGLEIESNAEWKTDVTPSYVTGVFLPFIQNKSLWTFTSGNITK